MYGAVGAARRIREQRNKIGRNRSDSSTVGTDEISFSSEKAPKYALNRPTKKVDAPIEAFFA